MKVYIISVLHTKTVYNEEIERTEKEVVASMPIAAFTDKQRAIKTMQDYMTMKEGSVFAPIYNMFRHGEKVSCSLTEHGVNASDEEIHSEVTLKTLELDSESFDIAEEVLGAWC